MGVESFSLPETISEEIRAWIDAGYYSSKSDAAKDAFRTLIETKPELKTTASIRLYDKGKVSLGRAAEMADMDVVSFKETLKEHGIERTTSIEERPDKVKAVQNSRE